MDEFAYYLWMPTTSSPSCASLLLDSPAELLPPQWVEPDVVVIDDRQGPMTIRLLEQHWGTNLQLFAPEKIRIISSIDRDNALHDRVVADDTLQQFAQRFGLSFQRADAAACDHGCIVPAELLTLENVMLLLPCSPPAAIAANGSLCITANAMDLAHALITGKVWYQRPPMQHVTITGTLHAPATLHDAAMHVRKHIKPDVLLMVHWQGSPNNSPVSTQLQSTMAALLQASVAQAVCFSATPSPSLFANANPDAIRCNLDHLTRLVDIPTAGVLPITNLTSSTAIDRAYIGSCSTGGIEDLRVAAHVLAGKKVAVPTSIAPASASDLSLLESQRLDPFQNGHSPTLLKTLQAAGCDIQLPGCSGCVNAIANAMTANEKDTNHDRLLTVISTAKASVTAQEVATVITASPYTTARVALTGILNKGR